MKTDYLTRTLVALLAVMLLTGMSIRFDHWLEGQMLAVFFVRFVVIGSVYAFMAFALYKSFKKAERVAKSNRGRPAKLEDAFCVGDAVKVLAVSKSGEYVVLRNYFGIKLVRMKKAFTTQPGKHYILDDEGNLIDLMRSENVDSDPEPVLT